jgi:hypothetical protein
MKHTAVDRENAEGQKSKHQEVQRARDVTDTIDDVRKSGGHIVTYSWQQFFEFKHRNEKSSVFVDRVKRTLADQGYLIVFGRNAVVVCSDYHFSPITQSQ